MGRFGLALPLHNQSNVALLGRFGQAVLFAEQGLEVHTTYASFNFHSSPTG
jgi:hypothetical protein